MAGLDETGRLCGGFWWAEARLFEILGGWVVSTPEPAVKLMLDRHSQHHAWRAGQWAERLMVAPPAFTPGPEFETPATNLARVEGTIGRLAGAYRVALPRLAVAYERSRGSLSPVADGSVLRTLELVHGDLVADWREGEAALQGVILDRAGAEAAAGVVGRLEAMVVGAGGGAGPA